jgi:hypothetical protein
MTDDNDTDIERILRSARTIAVVGVSDNPQRPSHGVALYLQAHGYRVIPVNPQLESVLGERCYARLEDIPEKVDIVDVFRRTEDVGPAADGAIAIGAACLWQQMGVVNEAAAAQARAAGLFCVMDRCIKVDHARLVAGG